MSPTKREHLVLIGPGGKRAGHTNQFLLACQLRAVQLTAAGQGGGIVSLLLPKTVSEKTKLQNLANRGYKAKTVAIRSNSRKEVRDAIMSDELMVALAELFLNEKGSSHKAMSALVREFSDWVCKKLRDHRTNQVQRIVKRAHPELLDRTSPDWWKKRIAQRKK